MPIQIRLVVWNPSEAKVHADQLRAQGFTVTSDLPRMPDLIRALRDRTPDALLIDLTRAPAQGRDLGVLLRRSAATRRLPLIFVGGEPAKVSQVRSLLPDAIFTTWRRVGPALRRAIARPNQNPVVPSSVFAAYAGRPLAAKLGIKPGMRVALVDAPPGFRSVLGNLPEGAGLQSQSGDSGALILWFVRTPAKLERAVDSMARRCGPHGMWILWRKRSSGEAGGLSQEIVRRAGLGAGLVDYKICSVDETWSGLRFARRKPRRA